MKNESLHKKTVGILVDAYFNKTLVHGNCHACAVGNIIAANMGYTFSISRTNHLLPQLKMGWKETGNTYINGCPIWYDAISRGSVKQYLLKGIILTQSESTGYTPYDLAIIETAFEYASTDGDYIFNGLMAVIDALDIIHENNNQAVTLVSKTRFHRIPQGANE